MKLVKRILSVLLTFALIIPLGSLLPSAESDTKLRFGSDGKFKIVVFADCQDGADPNEKMIDLMNDALDTEKPDLVAFTGDNILVSLESSFESGIQQVLQPVIDRDLPYIYTFGNHDDEYGLSKEYMHEYYSTHGKCLTYDAAPEISGFGNCNVPIYSSTGDDIAFNLWVIDSLSYESGTKKYNHVQQDQLDWYKKTSIELEQQAGHKVNSIMFQHIVMPEVYNLLVEDPDGDETYMGKTYRLELNSNASGYLGEFPCPPATNGGQFDALLERGDVLGVVSGHDHSNGFHGTYKGIGFIQMAGMSFRSYGDDNCRGYGVIEIDENDTSTYTVRRVPYIDFWNGATAVSTWDNSGYYGASDNGSYISEINIAQFTDANTAKNELRNAGYTLIDYDLNKNAGGRFIYMGYKITTDVTQAIRDIRFYIAGDEASKTPVTAVVNSVTCTYTRASDVDINKGVTGSYIYAYTSKDSAAGLPITEINLKNSVSSTDKFSGVLAMPGRPANLNYNTKGDEIYCCYTTVQELDVDALFEKTQLAESLLANNTFAKDSDKTLKTTLVNAQSVVQDLKEDGFLNKSQSDIDLLVSELNRGISLLTFEVKFVNYDGSLVESAYVTYGSSTSCSKIPVKPSDGENNYVFKGWDKDTSAVYSSMTVTALYDFEHYHTSDAPATCMADEVCKFCGEVMTAATGHGATVVKNVATATCDKDGYTGDTCCSVCGDVVLAGEVIEATGHSWSDWVYYTLPTVTSNGKDRSTCSVCKKTVYRETDKATTATVENEFIYGFKSNLAPDDVNGYFNEKYLTVSKTPYNGRLMGTNSIISVSQKNVTTDYVVVIFGDVNGDGWYDGQDAVIVSCLSTGMITKDDVSAAEYYAADCNHDGVIDEFDVALLNEAGSLLAGVDQSKTDAQLQTSALYAEYLEIIEQSPELEAEEKNDTPSDNVSEISFFDLVLSYLKRIIELLISYIPEYL